MFAYLVVERSSLPYILVLPTLCKKIEKSDIKSFFHPILVFSGHSNETKAISNGKKFNLISKKKFNFPAKNRNFLQDFKNRITHRHLSSIDCLTPALFTSVVL